MHHLVRKLDAEPFLQSEDHLDRGERRHTRGEEIGIVGQALDGDGDSGVGLEDGADLDGAHAVWLCRVTVSRGSAAACNAVGTNRPSENCAAISSSTWSRDDL